MTGMDTVARTGVPRGCESSGGKPAPVNGAPAASRNAKILMDGVIETGIAHIQKLDMQARAIASSHDAPPETYFEYRSLQPASPIAAHSWSLAAKPNLPKLRGIAIAAAKPMWPIMRRWHEGRHKSRPSKSGFLIRGWAWRDPPRDFGSSVSPAAPGSVGEKKRQFRFGKHNARYPAKHHLQQSRVSITAHDQKIRSSHRRMSAECPRYVGVLR